ncbi:MAG: GDSL-type esterase/lipase family protein [Parafilimonas sp.]
MSITTGLIWIFIFVGAMCLILLLKDKKPSIKKVIFFGDSITEYGSNSKGYIHVMMQIMHQQAIQNYQFINAGVSGDKVADLLLRIQDDVINKMPDIVVLWIGVNDVWHTNNLFAASDTTEFEKNYTAIVEKLLAGRIRLLLVTPALIGEKNDNSNALDNDLQNHCEVIRAVADKFKLLLCDMQVLFHSYELRNNKTNAIKGILTEDGVHLNDKGNWLAANEILKILTTM